MVTRWHVIYKSLETQLRVYSCRRIVSFYQINAQCPLSIMFLCWVSVMMRERLPSQFQTFRFRNVNSLKWPRRKQGEGPVAVGGRASLGQRVALVSRGTSCLSLPCLSVLSSAVRPPMHVHPFGGRCSSVFIAIIHPSEPRTTGYVWR